MKTIIFVFFFTLTYTIAPAQTYHQVLQASKYFDGIGVNISPIKYLPPPPSGDFIKDSDDSLYFENLKFFLKEAGFKYVRAVIPIELMCGNPTHTQDSILVVSRLNELYKTLGIKTFWVVNHYAVAPWDPLNYPGCHVDSFKMTNASYIDQVNSYINPHTNTPFGLDYIYAVEGFNEPEHFMVIGSRDTVNVRNYYKEKWDEITYKTQIGLFNKIRSNTNYSHIKVLSPSIWKFYEGAVDSLTAQGPIQNYFDAGNLHPYPNVIRPQYQWDKLKYHPSFYVPLYLQTFYNDVENYGNDFPKYVTETGYQSQISLFDTVYSDINELSAAKYMSFLHFEFFKNGIEKVLFYKLFEDGRDDMDDKTGLVKINYSTKPMFNTLINIAKIFSDTSHINTPIDSIGFTINYINPKIFNSIIYQQKDNQIILAIWRKDSVSACYDIDNNILSVSPVDFSITFNNSFLKSYLFDPVNSWVAVDSFSMSNNIQLSISDRVLLIKIIFDDLILLRDMNLENKIDIYPNPAKNIIYLMSNDNSHRYSHLEIFDPQGKLMLSDHPVILPKEISIHNFSAGTYILKLKTDNNSYITKKILKIY